MTAPEILFWIFLMMFVAAPTCAYMIMKFGTAGWFRAKQREKEKQMKETKDDYGKSI